MDHTSKEKCIFYLLFFALLTSTLCFGARRSSGRRSGECSALVTVISTVKNAVFVCVHISLSYFNLSYQTDKRFSLSVHCLDSILKNQLFEGISECCNFNCSVQKTDNRVSETFIQIYFAAEHPLT